MSREERTNRAALQRESQQGRSASEGRRGGRREQRDVPIINLRRGHGGDVCGGADMEGGSSVHMRGMVMCVLEDV